MLKKYNSIVVFDFETTGLDAQTCEIIELGLIRYEQDEKNEFQKVAEESFLVTPKGPFSEKITEITGITYEDTLSGISQEEAYKILKTNISDDTLLLAYNIGFDIFFLESLFNRFGTIPNYKFPNDFIDVLAVYRDLFPFPHRLSNAIETLKLKNVKNSHRATDDALATLMVLLKIQKMLKEQGFSLQPFVNVLGYNEKYGYKILPFIGEVTYISQPFAKQVILKR